MEVAIIDWKSIDSLFVRDELYEHISAPQWVDLAAPADPVDDEAWFCRPDCDHPKIVEDFFKQRTPPPKVQRSPAASVTEIPPLGERKQRDGKLKKRGVVAQPLISKWDKIAVEDGENQNPNLSTPPPNYYKSVNKLKEAVKSSVENKKIVDEHYHHKEEGKTPRLRRTLSARNLFGGGEILNKITDFCNELKKLATRAKEREENTHKENEKECRDGTGDSDKGEKERTPLLEKIVKQKQDEKPLRKKRCGVDDAENIIPTLRPTPISIDVKNNKRKEGQQHIRTYPPTPQCFSNANRATPPNVFKSKPLERGILKELVAAQSSNKEEEKKDCDGHGNNNNNKNDHASIIDAEKEAKNLDVFWFLKPCTL